MASLTQDVSITHGTAADIPRLEPLWVAVHHRHARSMPKLAYVSDAITWQERRALYEELFRSPTPSSCSRRPTSG